MDVVALTCAMCGLTVQGPRTARLTCEDCVYDEQRQVAQLRGPEETARHIARCRACTLGVCQPDGCAFLRGVTTWTEPDGGESASGCSGGGS